MQRTLIIFMLLISNGIVFGQLPVLEPTKTINTATGEMGFSLPIATVKGGSGNDFPVTLGYQAGIRLNQEASPVGLGFTHEAGSISRQIVFMPDDYTDNGDNDFQYTEQGDCTEPTWVFWLRFVFTLVSTVLSAISMGVGGAVGYIFSWASQFVSMLGLVVVGVLYSPADFSAGGTHMPQYDWKSSAARNGFFKGGNAEDMPDIYFVNTPYVSGQLVWIGDPTSGHFVFKQATGSPAKEKQTIQVDYDKTNSQYFKLTLPDGTKLIFDESDSIPQHVISLGTREQSGTTCKWYTDINFRRSVRAKWHLSKVLFNDYIDANGDDDPLNPTDQILQNKGAWVRLKYKTIHETGIHHGGYIPYNLQGDACQGHYVREPTDNSNWGFQNSPYSLQRTILGNAGVREYGVGGITGGCHRGVVQFDAASTYPTRISFLEEIHTPEEIAKYIYGKNRLDDHWRYESNDELYPMPAVTQLQIKKRIGNTIRSTVDFETDYSLRPGSIRSLPAVAGNTGAGCLTLKQLTFKGANGTALPPICFEYKKNPAITYSPHFKVDFNFGSYIHYFYMSKENRDMWGYYSSSTTANNDWNTVGDASRTVDCDAWSLSSINFPTGLKISWEYEPNRYDNVNGIAVSSSGGAPKYGGGIRVKSITANDGLGTGGVHDRKWSCFYSTMPTIGSLEETNATISGYASVEPFNYISETDYRASGPTKGGYYTPAKVAYERVIVAENYDAVNKVARNGFTVFDYYTTSDPGCRNEGTYGEIDNSWRRGQLKRVSQYNSANKLIAKQEYTFAFIESNDASAALDYSATTTLKTGLVRTGIIKPIQFDIYKDGVTSTEHLEYAETAAPTKNDCVKDNTKAILGVYQSPHYELDNPTTCTGTAEYRLLRGKSSYTDLFSTNNGAVVVATEWQRICNFTPGTDRNAWMNSESHEIRLNVIANIDGRGSITTPVKWNKSISVMEQHRPADKFVPSNRLFDYDGCWRNISGCPPHREDPTNPFYSEEQNAWGNTNIYEYKLCGAGAWCINSGNVPDLVVVYYYYDKSIPRTVWEYAIYWDISMLTDGTLSYTNRTVHQLNWGSLGMNDWKNCAFGDVTGTGGKLDLVFTGNETGVLGLATDIGPTGNVTNVYKGTTFIVWKGTHPELVDMDNDGKKNDLQIAYTEDLSLDRLNSTRSKKVFRQQVLKNVSLSGTTVITDAPVYTNNKLSLYLDYIPPYSDYFAGLSTNGKNEEFYMFWNDRKLSVAIYKPQLFWDFNGQPNQTTKTNSDGSKLIKCIVPAHVEYEQMATSKHMLTQQARSTSYKNSISNSNVVASTATIWNGPTQFGIDWWKPSLTYSWNMPMNSSGLPTTPMTDFVYGGTNLQWKAGGTIERYNSKGYVLETKDVTGVYSSTIYGHGGMYPTAAINNCPYEYCAIFTADYDDGVDPAYFDKENGWEKGGAGVTFNNLHFGQGCLFVKNAFGPTKNVRFDPAKDYVYSAWIEHPWGEYEGQTRFVRMAVEFHSAYPAAGTQIGAWDKIVNNLENGWHFYEHRLNKNELQSHLNTGKVPSDIKYVRIWIGNLPGETVADIYVDEIRFHPTNALVNTMYYDKFVSAQMVPIISIDPNNKPSQEVQYDEHGRPTGWFKFVNNSVHPPIKKNEYHLFDELLPGSNIRLLAPNIGGTFNVGDKVLVRWVNKEAGNITLSSINTDGSGEQTITTYTNQVGYGSYVWDVPVNAIGNTKKVKVTNTTKGYSDLSDNSFTVPGNKYGPLIYLSPDNGSYVGRTPRSVTLSWNGSGFNDGTISYRVWVGTSLQNMLYFDTNDMTYNYSVSNPTTTTYIWYIQPMRNGVAGTNGPVWSFDAGNTL